MSKTSESKRSLSKTGKRVDSEESKKANSEEKMRNKKTKKPISKQNERGSEKEKLQKSNAFDKSQMRQKSNRKQKQQQLNEQEEKQSENYLIKGEQSKETQPKQRENEKQKQAILHQTNEEIAFNVDMKLKTEKIPPNYIKSSNLGILYSQALKSLALELATYESLFLEEVADESDTEQWPLNCLQYMNCKPKDIVEKEQLEKLMSNWLQFEEVFYLIDYKSIPVGFHIPYLKEIIKSTSLKARSHLEDDCLEKIYEKINKKAEQHVLRVIEVMTIGLKDYSSIEKEIDKEQEKISEKGRNSKRISRPISNY